MITSISLILSNSIVASPQIKLTFLTLLFEAFSFALLIDSLLFSIPITSLASFDTHKLIST